MGLALLFPGQGGQHPAMLPWLDVLDPRPTALAELRARLGNDWRVRLGDAHWAGRNRVAQLLVIGASLAAWEFVRARLPVPVAVAGLSVGEMAAACAAGVFDVSTAMALTEQRAAAMDVAVTGLDTGLLVVSGATPAWLDAWCASHDLAVAIRFAPDQHTVGGRAVDLARACDAALAAGVSCTRLPVALASHTGWLSAAVAPMQVLLAQTNLRAPDVPWVSNYAGQVVRRPDAIGQALARQVAAVVQWDRCMDTLAERGARCVLELGPGRMLARAWQARHPDIPVRALEDFQQPAAAADWVHATLARR